jgi:hypothetical protein
VSFPWQFRVAFALAWCAVLLGLAAIPLAARRVSRTRWRGYVAAVVGLGISETLFAITVLSQLVPWWRVAAMYLANHIIPCIGASVLARAAVRRWPRHPWAVSVAAVSIALVSLVALATVLTRGLAFDVISVSS